LQSSCHGSFVNKSNDLCVALDIFLHYVRESGRVAARFQCMPLSGASDEIADHSGLVRIRDFAVALWYRRPDITEENGKSCHR